MRKPSLVAILAHINRLHARRFTRSLAGRQEDMSIVRGLLQLLGDSWPTISESLLRTRCAALTSGACALRAAVVRTSELTDTLLDPPQAILDGEEDFSYLCDKIEGTAHRALVLANAGHLVEAHSALAETAAHWRIERALRHGTIGCPNVLGVAGYCHELQTLLDCDIREMDLELLSMHQLVQTPPLPVVGQLVQ